MREQSTSRWIRLLVLAVGLGSAAPLAAQAVPLRMTGVLRPSVPARFVESADINCDGEVNLVDVQPFIALFTD